MATERLFADLASLAGIPADAYSIGEDVEGALCLVQTEDRFEVFHPASGARHELQVFPTEESACFYLFGVLAAEAVRNGTLACDVPDCTCDATRRRPGSRAPSHCTQPPRELVAGLPNFAPTDSQRQLGFNCRRG